MRTAARAIGVFWLLGMTAIASLAQTPTEKAWTVLNSGLTDKNPDRRTRAARILGELTGDQKAEEAAIVALKDEKEDVRAAAAQSLGEIGNKSAIPHLMEMSNDSEPSVILAAARALIVLGDNRGYGAFYAVLTGESKTGTSLTDQQKKILKDPRKLAKLGFETGMGFVPFGGMALTGFKLLTRDDTSPVLAAAALTLAKDPDPKSGQALANAATQEKKWLVRAAAFDALAKRGDPSLLHVAVEGLNDEKEEVQYSAAGAVIHLTDVQAGRGARPKATPAHKPATKKQ